MTDFKIFLEMGWNHILAAGGLDHKLFIIALAAIYQLADWRKVLILVTAFTIGHSISLALSFYDLIPVNIEFIEFLIPVTILITAVSNLFRKEYNIQMSKIQTNYIFASGFGLIHGMAFSHDLKLMMGKDKIISQLLAFNLGLEIGQIIVVVVFLLFSFIFVDLIGVARRDWKMVISSAVGGVALYLIIQTDYWQNILF